MREAYAYCEELVRAADKDRFLATLFAPAEKRPHIFALYAFNAEIARIREFVKEPMPGEIRLQWWRDVISEQARGEMGGNPVAAALLDTLPLLEQPHRVLQALIDARQFDLYNQPMPSLAALEEYARATASGLFQLIGTFLCGDGSGLAGAADSAGLAYAYTGLWRVIAVHASRGQIYLPLDMLTRHGATIEDILAGRFTQEFGSVLAEMRGLVRQYLEETQAQLKSVPEPALPAFLPVALVQPYLARMEQKYMDPLREVIELPQWRRQWLLWRAARHWH